ncbi:histidine kinase [Stylonychia lemnae]|uniref:Histidine kinase n=1 Tax=Stylonychia lemnae TaxID=5949 RepID=A0A078B3H8_STYLE|nr:histidine kinase [Stylonychia lemnae]|eukprot:CDW89085.1 histidine kinase [Stylonychia lemnae]
MQRKVSSVQFGQLYEQKRIQERNIQIAKSILDSIDQLETEPDAVKRWGWELIQNAQDASDSQKPVKIRIILEEDKLRFMHNGRPFSLKDIMNLVEKGSDKERPQYYSETQTNEDDFDSFTQLNSSRFLQQTDNVKILSLDDMVIPETTGRFGTGFLTTYLLSKRVSVDGVFHHTDEDQSFYKRFQLILNRDTKDVEKMLFYNQKSSEVFKNLDDDEKWPFIENYESGINYDTCFTYYLSEQGIRNAHQGLKNLLVSIPYVMGFSKKIESIEIFDKIEQQNQQYTFRIDRNPILAYGDIQVLKYFLNEEEKLLIYAFNKYSQLACLIQQRLDNIYEICEKDDDVPNFFVDYPLIGSQSLKFSVVFNSHLFYPNEKRSGICLDEKLGFKALLNSLVMQKLSVLFENFLDFVINQGFANIHHLRLSSKHLAGNQKAFLNKLLITPIISKFVQTSIIECKGGLAPLKSIMIPDIGNKELQESNQQISEFKLYVDQNSQLKRLKDLKIDDGIDEFYKKICQQYGYDLRPKLFQNNYIPLNYQNVPRMSVEQLDDDLTASLNRVLDNLKKTNITISKCNVKTMTEKLWKLCARINVHFLRKQIKSLETLCELEQKLGLQCSALEFLKQFYLVIQDYQKLYSAKSSITRSVMFNNKDENLRKYSSEKIYSYQIQNDQNVANAQNMNSLFNMYLEIKGTAKDFFFQRTLHTSLTEDYVIKHISNHENFTAIKMCSEFDQIIVKQCENIDYVKSHESFINRFDKLYQTTFKEKNLFCAKNLDYYFPQYQRERKNILVKLRQNGEMTNLLYEIYQNEQEELMRLLTKVKNSNFEILEEIMKFMGQKDDITSKILDVMRNEQFQRINDQELKELIKYIQQIVGQKQPQSQVKSEESSL